MTNPFGSSTGGHQCPICLTYVPAGDLHYCAGSVPRSNLPSVTASYPIYGWTCPVCGNGCAPWLDTCPGPHFDTALTDTTGAPSEHGLDGE